MFTPYFLRSSACATVLPTSASGAISFEIFSFSESCTKSSIRAVSSRCARRIAISRSGYTTSAPSFSRISPCSALDALAMTFLTPMPTSRSTARIDVSISSPMHTTATSHSPIPVASSVSRSRFFTTNAFSVNSRNARTFSSSRSSTIRSVSPSASSSANAWPKRPRPITP